MSKNQQAKILVVDDDQRNCETICIGLTTLGYQVIEAGNGQEGYAKALQQKPDLIISDHLLSDFTGYELLKKVRQLPQSRELPFLLLSGRPATKSKTDLALPNGCSFILKPVGASALGDCVQGLLKRKRGLKQEKLTSAVRLRLEVPSISV